MSHPPRLIHEIAALVAADYPVTEGYEYVFEKAIKNTRMMPDILVTHSGRHVCAVEIGYTRPEKLTAYRNELRISDVRWYDKKGLLHADVKERHVNLKVNISVQSPHTVAVHRVEHEVFCVDCMETDHYDRGVPGRAIDRYIRRFGKDAYEQREERNLMWEKLDVMTWVITDDLRIWLPSFCDKCGRNWFADPEDDADVLYMDCDTTPRERGHRLGARVLMTGDGAITAVREQFGLELNYIDGYFLHEGCRAVDPIAAKIAVERERARTEP